MVSHYDTEMTRLSPNRSIREKLYARNPDFSIYLASYVRHFFCKTQKHPGCNHLGILLLRLNALNGYTSLLSIGRC